MPKTEEFKKISEINFLLQDDGFDQTSPHLKATYMPTQIESANENFSDSGLLALHLDFKNSLRLWDGILERYKEYNLTKIQENENDLSFFPKEKPLSELFKECYTELDISGKDNLKSKAEKLKKISKREILTLESSLKDSIRCVKKNCYKTFSNSFLKNSKTGEETSKIAENVFTLVNKVYTVSANPLKFAELRDDYFFKEDLIQTGYNWNQQVEKLEKDPIMINSLYKEEVKEFIYSIHNVSMLHYKGSMFFYLAE